MQVLEAIQNRRSIKKFDPNHKISEKDTRELFDLARLSPTAFNIQHWRFVSVTDTDLREKIKAVSWNQAQVTDASLLVIVCADLKAWSKDPARYWANAPKEAQEMLVPAIGPFYDGNDQVQRDEAFRSCGIAAQTLMLAAQGLGYDSCPMDGFDFDAVAKLINLPEDHVITMFVTIGKKLEPAFERGGQLSHEEIVVENTF